MGKHADSLDLYEYCTKLDPEIIKQKVYSNKLFFNSSYALYSLEKYEDALNEINKASDWILKEPDFS